MVSGKQREIITEALIHNNHQTKDIKKPFDAKSQRQCSSHQLQFLFSFYQSNHTALINITTTLLLTVHTDILNKSRKSFHPSPVWGKISAYRL